MSTELRDYRSRDARFVPEQPMSVSVRVHGVLLGWVENVSARGMLLASDAQDIRVGEVLSEITAGWHGSSSRLPDARVVRVTRQAEAPGQVRLIHVACSFEEAPSEAFTQLRDAFRQSSYVTHELVKDVPKIGDSEPPEEQDLREFEHSDTSRLLGKCAKFSDYMESLRATGLYQSLYRVTLTTPLDHRVSIYNPVTQREEDFVCFDSNSYLGLHIHPRVIEVTQKAIGEFGYGTPSAQLLSGTNKHLRELEETISRYHGRESTIVFSSGYSANIGAITALVGRHDFAVADQYSHTSVHDGCAWANPKQLRTYPHKDTKALRDVLERVASVKPHAGKLVVSDGVFSMHGSVADLPALREACDATGSTLMIDEAHSTGVLGPTGRGLEELFGCNGAIDVLVGTFSKAPGTAGGYVTGDEELITYLRFFANSAMFSASLPAALCAGVNEAFKIMAEDSGPRERLWSNVHWLAPAIEDAGLRIPSPESPILTVFIGDTSLLWQVSREMYDRGVKCGNVCYPAVPPGEGILRISVNARHSKRDLERCVAALVEVGQKYDLLGRDAEDLQALGGRYRQQHGLARVTG